MDPEDIERALMNFTPEEQKNPDTTSRSYNDYNIGMDIGSPEPTEKAMQNNARSGPIAQSELVPGQPLDMSFENNPIDFEDINVNGNVMNNYQDQNVNGISDDASMVNNLRTDKGTNLLNQYSREQVPNTINKVAPLQNSLGSNSDLIAAQQSFFPKTNDENGKKFLDVEIQNGGSPADDSGIILNIEKIRGPKRITAEEQISKLISSCLSDYECSEDATCARSNLKQPGYCKCLPSFYGVGIFCREDKWIGKNNIGIEEFHNPDDVPYSSSKPLIEETGVI